MQFRQMAYREVDLALGGEVVGNSPKELADFMAAERVRWKKVIETANVTVD
jgi:hypothetical protein